jgi:hypothetical protein
MLPGIFFVSETEPEHLWLEVIGGLANNFFRQARRICWNPVWQRRRASRDRRIARSEFMLNRRAVVIFTAIPRAEIA